MANPLTDLPTQMTLTELLRHHLPPESTQKSIAMDWLARIPKSGDKHQRSTSYVESQLSRCLKGEAPAVRFFFAERERGVLLLDAMTVPENQREAILAAADRVMNAKGEPLPKMVIDLTQWSGTTTAKHLFDALRMQIVEPQPLQPAVLLLTDMLYDMLPRSFDAAKWLRVEVVDASDAASCVLELTNGGALLASPTRQVEPERWLAIDYHEATKTLIFEPSDGLMRFAREGKLPLPPVEHDLVSCISDAALESFDPTKLSPIEIRRLMVRLRDEKEAERVDPDARKRLAMAKALGIAAVATPRDRLEAELRTAADALGVTDVQTMSADAFSKLIDKAQRRPSPPTVVRVDDELHYVNPAPAHPGLDHPHVRVHRFEPAEPWISRLRAAVAGWTVGDFEADPFLVGVMDQLDPDRKDVLSLLHARAWLLSTKTVHPRRADHVEDWRTAVRSILSERVPEALLRIARDDHGRSGQQDVGFYTLPPNGRVADKLPSVDADTASRLRHVSSPSRAIPFGRAAPLYLAKARSDGWSGSRQVSTSLVLPNLEADVDAAIMDGHWLDAYDAFLARSSFRGHVAYSVDVGQAREHWPWQEADSLLANIWLALHAAVDLAPAVRSTKGSILLSLGSGIAAEISVTATASDVGQLRTIIDFITGYSLTSSISLTTSIDAGIDSVKYSVPAGVVLLAGRIRAEIHFTASPLLIGLGTPMVLSAAAQSAQAAADDAARRAAYDDDDD